ncbi:hypothetical protein QBC35DRAFT_531169 [Podospora australis]|uniref:Uncharacterized protein n=1 Tax=Podospora australis TaxID=1536484 RepID=A0AAN7AHP4_9PEZI|nr:hypothetical protein QBC35DRAFT_531169 [Podospora australis]
MEHSQEFLDHCCTSSFGPAVWVPKTILRPPSGPAPKAVEVSVCGKVTMIVQIWDGRSVDGPELRVLCPPKPEFPIGGRRRKSEMMGEHNDHRKRGKEHTVISAVRCSRAELRHFHTMAAVDLMEILALKWVLPTGGFWWLAGLFKRGPAPKGREDEGVLPCCKKSTYGAVLGGGGAFNALLQGDGGEQPHNLWKNCNEKSGATRMSFPFPEPDNALAGLACTVGAS